MISASRRRVLQAPLLVRIRFKSCFPAVEPMDSAGWAMAEIRGLTMESHRSSSEVIRAIFWGMGMEAFFRNWYTPIAARLFPQSMAWIGELSSYPVMA